MRIKTILKKSKRLEKHLRRNSKLKRGIAPLAGLVFFMNNQSHKIEFISLQDRGELIFGVRLTKGLFQVDRAIAWDL